MKAVAPVIAAMTAYLRKLRGLGEATVESSAEGGGGGEAALVHRNRRLCFHAKPMAARDRRIPKDIAARARRIPKDSCAM